MSPGPFTPGMFTQEKRQPNGFETQILPHRLFGLAAVVALGKQKVDRLVDSLSAPGYFRRVRNFHKNTRKAEQFPRTSQSFFDGVFTGEQSIGDLRNAEAAKRFQYERH